MQKKLKLIFVNAFLFVLNFYTIFARIVQPTVIDNELVGDPIVECEETMITVTFNTKKPFNGRIYVQGMADDEHCSKNFASNPDQSKFFMIIQNGDCTMQRQRITGTLEGMMLSLTLFVSFHGTFVTKSDRAFHCMCLYKNIKQVTNALDVNLIGTTEIMDTVKTPTCQYSIHTQNENGPQIALGKVGDKIVHVWECDDSEHAFLVHSCSVDDGRGSKFELLDIDGCAIDPVIQPDVIYDEKKNMASVETYGYKFSDTTVLNYQCKIELCKKLTNECEGLTPPICGRQKRNIKRTHRSLNSSSADDIDLLTTLKILDNIDEKETELDYLKKNTTSKNLNSVELLMALTPQIVNNAILSSQSLIAARDCVRSMIVAFVISLITAIAFILGATFIILRRFFTSA